MVRIRRFEQAALKYYQAGKIGGFLHLYIGQEAVAVGTISLGGPDDHFITAYRDHGHALAVGMGMNECMAEMYGKQEGCARGRGGPRAAGCGAGPPHRAARRPPPWPGAATSG